jgi:hypothetical protein
MRNVGVYSDHGILASLCAVLKKRLVYDWCLHMRNETGAARFGGLERLVPIVQKPRVIRLSQGRTARVDG